MLITEIAILLLLLVACLSAVSFKRINFPFTVGLVIIGFALGFMEQFGLPVEGLRNVVLSPDLILFIFVPPLIFESAINLENRLLARNLTPILVLAGPGLVISMLVVGFLMAWLTPLSLSSAMLFGALISATDPVAVIALFKEIGVPKRLTVLVEGESMLNDATAIVAFELVLFIITSGALEATTAGEVLARVTIVLLGGVLVGWVMGTLLGYAMILVSDDALIQATVSIIVAYMTFIIAEHVLEVSGVIAVMVAGLVLGRYKSRRLAPKMRVFFHEFWEYAAFLANSLIFLLVGLSTAGFLEQFQTGGLQGIWLTMALAIVVVTVARAIIVFSLVPPLNRFLRDGPINWRYQSVIFWGGLRGAVALALVLSLDTSFADRNVLIALTLGVALFTIVVCGTSVKSLISKLKIDEPTIIDRLSEAEALFLARQETVSVLDEIRDKEPIQPWVLNELGEHYRAALRQAEAGLREVWTELNATPILRRRALWLQALALEQKGYQKEFDARWLSESTLGRLQLLVELRRDAVFTDQIPPPMPAYETLDTRWAKMVPALAGSNSPAGELLGEVMQAPSSDWVKQQQRLQVLRGQYEFDMAIFMIAEQVVSYINELGEQQVVAPEVARECAGTYQGIRERALERLQSVAEQYPKLVLEMQNHIVRQGALERSEKLLEGLVTQGIISKTVAERISAQLEGSE